MTIYLDTILKSETGKGNNAELQNKTAAVALSAVLEKKVSASKNKSRDKTFCPYCSRESVLIWIHGHYQCSRCKYVVIGCCEAN